MWLKHKIMGNKVLVLNLPPNEAGQVIGELKHSALKTFLMALANKIASDGLTAAKNGKETEAKALHETSIELYNAGRKLEKAIAAKEENEAVI